MWLLIHAGITVNPCLIKGAPSVCGWCSGPASEVQYLENSQDRGWGPGGHFNIKIPSYQYRISNYKEKIDGLGQERCNSTANALELLLMHWSYIFLASAQWDSLMTIISLLRESLHLERRSYYWKGPRAGFLSILDRAKLGHDQWEKTLYRWLSVRLQ